MVGPRLPHLLLAAHNASMQELSAKSSLLNLSVDLYPFKIATPGQQYWNQKVLLPLINNYS